jgi:hypothetical protein
MQYLNYDLLDSIDPDEYRAIRPFPWINPEGALTEDGYRTLLESLPPVSQFAKAFGYERKHGQQGHDRYTLEYEPGLDPTLPAPWVEFIRECEAERYRAWLCRMFDVAQVAYRFHWHYTPNGCSVSPHCDSVKKLGSHIFYFNTAEDWDASWGGETVVLDDGGRFNYRSAPAFDEFDGKVHSKSMGNRSLLFTRTNHAWHGVEPIRCPEGHMRKVFIVVVNKVLPRNPVLRAIRKLRDATAR